MLKKLITTYKLHLIVMIGTNLAGLINFAFSLILFKIATEESFNLYSALASYLVIISTPGDLIKKLSTSFGEPIKDALGFYLKKTDKRILMIFSLILILGLSSFVATTTGASLASASLLVCAVVIGLYSAILSGLLQNRQEFFYTSVIAVVQSTLKIALGLILFLSIGDIGIWITLYITSVITALSLRILSRKYTDTKADVSNTSTLINKKDLLTNLFLILVLEILLNADSIIAINKLNSSDAYIYNSLSLVRKTMLFSLLGFSAIILSESRRLEVNKIHMLIKNIIITFLIGGTISLMFIVFKPIVLSYLKLDNGYTVLYLKFILSSLLFVILLMSTTWFTALKSMPIRIIIGCVILIFNILYYFLFDTIEQAINYQLFGIIAILSIQFVVIVSRINNRT